MLPNLFYIINFSLAIVVSIIALIVGFLTVIIFVINRQCRRITNLLGCNTAPAVIFYYILNLFSSVSGLRDDGSYNQPACIFRAYCYTTSSSAICYSYLTQAISRLFFVVFYKTRSLVTWRIHRLMIIINWFISITVPIVPSFFNGAYGSEKESHFCVAISKIYFTSMYTAIGVYLIPFSAIVVIYGTIYYYARQSTRRVIPLASSTITARTTSNIPNIKREIRLMKNMLILIDILTCARVPYLILIFWHVIQRQSSSPPQSFYLLSMNSVSISATLMTINLF